MPERNGRRDQKSLNCYQCGQSGHFACDKRCPARSKTCTKIPMTGYFTSVCRAKNKQERKEKNRRKQGGQGKVNYVEDVEDDENAFTIPQLQFMGYLLSTRGIGPTESKVEAVVNAREPESVAEVRSFMGLVNFSAKFIPNLATVTEPLRQLTRKGVTFKWGEKEQEAFKALKETLTSVEKLANYEKDAKTRVIADASPVGLGVVLVKEQKGNWRLIYYESRSLTTVEERYSQTEREALALVWVCERFHVCLYEKHFELETDHEPLELIYSSKSQPSARIERWVLRLHPYEFTVLYCPGPQNIAYALSPLTQEVSNESKNVAEEYV
ncbi:Retrovirus-related Pol polyprotein from transposon 17.6 [Stylophora pistillata]|uniref:Retrovirus-related Pol polyprotein from transposon 17.6 n=1 Tax=Stylophora pistillata TaxID=50429 RepID=A0A2B4RKH0_STYPI|nr:Retrovirus-related Pol polyprotein from transposon 17.6 [Stylophora pistillata]